jgi:hypothetical protein
MSIRMKSNFPSLLLFCILAFAGCQKSTSPGAGADPVDLLPADNDVSGFLKKGNPSILTDAASIYEAIDGAAEKYIELGFVEGVFLKYSNGSADIDVSIFNHGTNENALKVLEEFYPSSPEVLLSGVETMVVDHGLLVGYSIHYVKGSLYMRLDTKEKTDFILNMAKQFCLSIGSKIEIQ